MLVDATVRFSRCGEFENSEEFLNVEIPDDTKEDDEAEAILEAISNDIEDMFEGDEDWDNGDISWEVFAWSKV